MGTYNVVCSSKLTSKLPLRTIMIFESYLPQSPSSVKLQPKRRTAITSTSSPKSETTTANTSIAMGIVDYEQQSSGIDSAAEPPPGCDRDSLWWALVMVASQRYDEMTQQEADEEEASKVEESTSTVVQEDDADDRLVIDEAEPPTTPRDAAKRKAPEEPTSGDYQVPVRYNANMARKFPGAENRTPEQQAVRQRNTVAARQSRAKMRIMEEMLTQEATDERTINEYMKERIGACFMYGNALRDVLQLEEADFWAEFQLVKDEYIAEPLRSLHVVPRTISDGSCSDYQDYSEDDEGEEEEEEEEGQQPGTSADTVGNRRG
ncbi:uncharacterized protein LOC120418880 [Culex pipiens pallens]|uniref:uncharacterized protein LOC120418880 n=1 Tax=Culex pipiens pallens TaxID=42434 RepID=UPI001954B5B5|nr:uncharacterized protein LOC120418880 [Culex pipiens pallens]